MVNILEQKIARLSPRFAQQTNTDSFNFAYAVCSPKLLKKWGGEGGGVGCGPYRANKMI